MTLLQITLSVRIGTFNGGGNGGAANRTIGVVAEPQINARNMKRVLANAKLPNLLSVGEHRQTHRTLAADFSRVSLLLVLHSGNFYGRNAFHVMTWYFRRLAGDFVGGRSPATRRWASEGEDESIDQSRNGDDRYESEEKLQRR